MHVYMTATEFPPFTLRYRLHKGALCTAFFFGGTQHPLPARKSDRGYHLSHVSRQVHHLSRQIYHLSREVYHLSRVSRQVYHLSHVHVTCKFTSSQSSFTSCLSLSHLSRQVYHFSHLSRQVYHLIPIRYTSIVSSRQISRQVCHLSHLSRQTYHLSHLPRQTCTCYIRSNLHEFSRVSHLQIALQILSPFNTECTFYDHVKFSRSHNFHITLPFVLFIFLMLLRHTPASIRLGVNIFRSATFRKRAPPNTSLSTFSRPSFAGTETTATSVLVSVLVSCPLCHQTPNVPATRM